MLIEDHLAEARFLQEALNGTMLQRFHLVHVKRLGEAIALLQPGSADQSPPTHFDAALLDLTLPDSQGLASLDSLVRYAPSLPIVVLTNTNDEELAVEAVRHGAQDYLVKRQLNQDTLVRSLRYAIERKQGAEALREANEILEHRVQERTAALAMTNQLLKQEVEWRQRIQDRLELAQRAGKIGTFEWTIASNEVSWTAELEALYGLTPGIFDGRYDSWIETIYPDDRDRIEQELWQAIQTRQEFDTECRILWPSGEVRWMVIKGCLFYDAMDRPQRMIGIHMDVTEKKQLEAQFLRAQRLESLGTLASGIAHDLNNILTPILAIVQLLPLKIPDLNDQSRQMLATLQSSAHRGAELIKQILSFARGVEGKRVNLQVSYLLSEVLKIIEQTLPKSIEIRTNIPTNLWTVLGDATQLHQVLMNLCVNARDAMPQGGTLTIAAENLSVDESYARSHLEASVGTYVVVTIADTGMGIADEVIHRIFDPFFTTKEIGKGTGLGLSAVLGIVKSHGGFVDVQSEVGQGSQFKVYLPANQGSVISVQPDLELLVGQQELVLVVDDETAICEITKTTLESYNYRVLTVNDGIEAIALFAQHQSQIRAVLMDLMMPSMDGLSAIPLLRRFKPDLYVVAMSGINSTETIAQTEKAGFQAFLAKPFTTQDLLQILHQGLRGKA